MDRILVLLDARVAEAAEAWLADPRDAGVYARLVAAIGERRRHLDAAASPAEPEVDLPAEPSDVPGPPSDVQGPASDVQGPASDVQGPAADVQSELDERAAASIRPVGAALAGDPREALARLRRGQAP
ncbi:hypothetical protein ACPPVT_20715 [Angustibacter sp. McL0619]|uniref:hypothetical protein n=1 Tax=Angustibacter sp. McL0619 TaxID=3415676 RepID=UPI003CF137B2